MTRSPNRLDLVDAEIRAKLGDAHVDAMRRLRDGDYQLGDAEKFGDVMDYFLWQRSLH